MRLVFLDTVGLIAAWDSRDQWHNAAALVYHKLLAERARVVTSEFVLMECANAASRTTFRSVVADIRSTLLHSGCLLLPDDGEFSAAWSIYRDGRAGQPGIVDLLSFALMRRYGITEAFTNDQHFRAAGFLTLF